jgi:hypothetical protein
VAEAVGAELGVDAGEPNEFAELFVPAVFIEGLGEAV